MSIEYIDEIADAMVEVCVRDFGAKPIDDKGLLWEYFRQRLLEAARDVQDELRTEQNESMRKIRASYATDSIRKEVKKKQDRREKAAELMVEQEQP